MPFIDSKITVKVSDEKKEAIKTELGQAISILSKPESFLMVGFDDEYCLYMGGSSLEKVLLWASACLETLLPPPAKR